MAIVFLVVSVLLAVAVATTYVPIRRDPITGIAFVTGWLTAELAGQLFVVNALVVSLMAWLGETHGPLGHLAVGIDAAAAVGLLGLVALGFLSRSVVAEALGSTPGLPIAMAPQWRQPVWGRWWRIALGVAMPGRNLEWIRNVDYTGDDIKAHRLDIVRPRVMTSGAPVLIWVHGGAWTVGDKREQGRPLMFELAARGWVCVTVNYRLSPKATWPDHITDVMRSIAWVKEHIADYGGDPRFVALSGGSAGGHLAALAALAPDDPAFKVGFEVADTSVDVCVPIYGVLEMTAEKATSGKFGPGLRLLLERQVMKARIAEDRSLFEAASPMHRIHADAPPFFVIHGRNDTLVPVAVPRTFVPALRAVSAQPVAYLELPFAQHAFDVLPSPRSAATVSGIVAFLETVRAQRASMPSAQEKEARG